MKRGLTRRTFLSSLAAAAVGVASWRRGSGALIDAPRGPFEASWDSIRAHYKTPTWFRDAKFGVFLHWGLYAVPGHQSEWYCKHMYNNPEVIKWHAEHFGPQDKFGYKDFIPLFTCAKYDPDQWAELFKRAGARYVVPTAEHHDGFAMWDSKLTRWCAAKMGPKRDLIGDLAKAVRKQGMKFGVSNHRLEHYNFLLPGTAVKSDLFDPAYADFYGPHDRGRPDAKFMEDWVARNVELFDQYQPDMMYYDNGVNPRFLDAAKLKVAAYYYNRATEWGKEVSIATKADAYLAGSIKDYERQGRAPTSLQSNVFQVDDSVLQRWGYLTDAKYCSVGSIVTRLVENVSRNGNLLMNFAPKADGTIPDEQVALLEGMGKWLGVCGEAIYETRPWTIAGEGVTNLPKGQRYSPKDIRFTTKGDTLYALLMAWPTEPVVITSIAADGTATGKVSEVKLLGNPAPLKFVQTDGGLAVTLPVEKPCEHVWALKIGGLKLGE